jgi:hypothetical protein
MYSSNLPTSHFARKSSTSYWCVLCNLWRHEFHRVQEGTYIFIITKEVIDPYWCELCNFWLHELHKQKKGTMFVITNDWYPTDI